jgi:hypothetical protein
VRKYLVYISFPARSIIQIRCALLLSLVNLLSIDINIGFLADHASVTRYTSVFALYFVSGRLDVRGFSTLTWFFPCAPVHTLCVKGAAAHHIPGFSWFHMLAGPQLSMTYLIFHNRFTSTTVQH